MKPLLNKILSENKFFLLAFVVWFIGACTLLFFYTDKELFFAINKAHNSFFDPVMTVFSAYGRGDSIVIVFVLLLIFPLYRNKKYLLTTLSFGFLLPLINYFGKEFFSKARPIGEYNLENVHTVPWLVNLYNNSFPSGHTMGAFGFFFLLSYFVPNKNKLISVFLFLLAVGVGYSRIYLGQHFFSDVVAGSFVGVFVSLLIVYAVNLYVQKKDVDA